MRDELTLSAVEYARMGVSVTATSPVVPAAPATMSRWLGRREWKCTCEAGAHCSTPGEHPLRQHPDAMTSVADVEATWTDAEVPPNVMISPGDVLDVWEVPREVGPAAMHVLEQLRPRIWPPVMKMRNGSWVFCTAKLHESAIGTAWMGLRRLAPTDRVLVPPSRTPSGALRWVWSQRFQHTPPPKPWLVLCAFAAGVEQLGILDGRDDLATAVEAEPSQAQHR